MEWEELRKEAEKVQDMLIELNDIICSTEVECSKIDREFNEKLFDLKKEYNDRKAKIRKKNKFHICKVRYSHYNRLKEKLWLKLIKK